MTFTFDEDATLDAMAYASTVDLLHGQVTLYATVCIGSGREPHFSHGGQLTLDANEAIELAKAENETMAEVGGDCRYLPMAVGLHPLGLFELARALASDGYEEPGSGG
jgi:hypothetical protein